MKELHREVRRHAHDDRLLDLCGGLQSTIARLDALLARHAPPGADDPTCTTGSAATAPALVDVLLGVIAIRNRLAAAFESAPATAASVGDEHAAVRPPRPESLLR